MQISNALKVREIIAGRFQIDPRQITDEARFRDDLEADWLDRLEVIIAIEVAGFEMSHVVADRIDTVPVRQLQAQRSRGRVCRSSPLRLAALPLGGRRSRHSVMRSSQSLQ
jgi:acyl carrier protein